MPISVKEVETNRRAAADARATDYFEAIDDFLGEAEGFPAEWDTGGIGDDVVHAIQRAYGDPKIGWGVVYRMADHILVFNTWKYSGGSCEKD